MKKIITILPILVTLVACENPNAANEIEYEFPECGESALNEKIIKRVCATRDYEAKSVKRSEFSKALATIASGGHSDLISTPNEGVILEFENQELDMQRHIWDFSKQDNPELVLNGHDSIIKNGIILNAYLSLGSNEYLPPNFSDEKELTNNSDLYAKVTSSNNNIENFRIIKFNMKGRGVTLNSWGGEINSSIFILKNNINIQGSKTNIENNVFVSEANIVQDRSIFRLNKINKSISLNSSKQIFPDRSYDNTAIASILYIKFSPDTVIDGNTFTLTQKNNQAYAIVLDHSPRVRITNNTFNGFKVPILMDQWSSIVDEKGNEIKPENFKGYGNVINPNKFAGNVTMNRKGEIVLK